VEEEKQSVIARNEALFREINEGIERGQWPGEEDAPVGFRCECARLGCNELIELTIREYERVRANPRCFLLAPGHELPDGETVVDTGLGYVVVEKRDQAGAAAEATDPRR
jgi:hypothetical protein